MRRIKIWEESTEPVLLHTYFSLHIEASKNFKQNEKMWFISVAKKLPVQYQIRAVLHWIIEPCTEYWIIHRNVMSWSKTVGRNLRCYISDKYSFSFPIMIENRAGKQPLYTQHRCYEQSLVTFRRCDKYKGNCESKSIKEKKKCSVVEHIKFSNGIFEILHSCT